MSSIAFTGSNQHYAVSSAAPLVVTPPLTFLCWVAPGPFGTGMEIMGIYDASSVNQITRLQVGAAGNLRVSVRDTGATPVGTGNSFAANNWGHAAFVLSSSSSRRALLNGSTAGAVNQTTTKLANPTSPRVGMGASMTSAPADWFTGRLAMAAIWRAALTDAEVQAHLAGAPTSSIRPRELVHWWPRLSRLSAGRIVDVRGGCDLFVTGAVDNDDAPAINHPPRRAA